MSEVCRRELNKVIDFQIGDRTKYTFYKVFDRINNNNNYINYFCTDGLEAYTTRRFSSIKDDKYINEEYYRKIDRRIEEIKKKKKKKKEKEKGNKNENNNKQPKTMRGKLKIKKKILEKNKYRNENGFSIHIANKSETCLIESVNSRIRNYLARFNRKTKRYSKSIGMIKYSLYLLFDKLYWNILIK